MKEEDIFFSVIIPTYNPKEYLPTLLESISHNECTDKIEVIISDDCSTEPFDDIINYYKDKLIIREISNKKHTGFPRDGRQHGSEVAMGKWICFADQDDYYIDNAFDEIYNAINESGAQYMLIGDFIEESIDTGETVIRNKLKGWTHGKFYEKIFWDEYKISYDKVKYCEDINLSNKINCIMTEKRLVPFEYDKPIYVWKRRKDSLADLKYFADSMPDYMRGNLKIIIQYLARNKKNKELFNDFNVKFIGTMLHAFFYLQSYILWDNKGITLKTVQAMQPYYTKFKKLNDITNEQFVNITTKDLMLFYEQTRKDDFSQIPFVEQISFRQWIEAYFE